MHFLITQDKKVPSLIAKWYDNCNIRHAQYNIFTKSGIGKMQRTFGERESVACRLSNSRDTASITILYTTSVKLLSSATSASSSWGQGKWTTIGFIPIRLLIMCPRWVLRELSLADLSGVKEFIKRNYEHMSREGLRYAIEKMSGQDKAKLLAYTGSASSEEISEVLSESAEPSDDEDLVVPKKGKKVTKKRKIEEVSEDEDEGEDEKPIRTRSAKAARRK